MKILKAPARLKRLWDSERCFRVRGLECVPARLCCAIHAVGAVDDDVGLPMAAKPASNPNP